MATRTFHFPNSTESFMVAGNTYRIEIIHTIAGVTSYDHDCGVIPSFDEFVLDLTFEISPSEQTFKFPSMKLKFFNLNNIFESPNPVFDWTNQEFQTFVRVLRNGSAFWYGIVNYDSIKYNDWYLSGSTLYYRIIEFEVFDRMAYFWWNKSITMTDVGFSVEDYFYNWIDDIFDYIGMTTQSIDSNLSITEACGTIYDYAEYRADHESTDGTFASLPVYKVLKDIMLLFCVFIFNYNGTVYVVRRVGGTAKTIAANDIKFIEKAEEIDTIEYVKLSSQKNYSAYADSGDYLHSVESGSSGVVDNKKFIISDIDKFLSHVYVDYDGASTADYPSPAGDVDASSNGQIIDADVDFWTNDIEPGFRIIYDIAGGGSKSCIILSVPDQYTINFTQGAGLPGGTLTYFIDRTWEASPPYNDIVYKIHSILTKSLADYVEWFTTSHDNLLIELKSITEYIALHGRFSVMGLNWRISEAKVDFKNDDLSLKLRRVS